MALRLVQDLLQRCDPSYGIGTVTSSVWDTAWVSMLRSKDGKSWAFPECFEYLVKSQASNGGWGNPFRDIEQICCSLVAILAIKTRLNTLCEYSEEQWLEIDLRCSRAIQFVKDNLPSWSIDNTDDTLPVGLELYLPVLLLQLERYGVSFNVPGIERVNKMREMKLRKIPAEALYGESKLAGAYSLEGFIGHVDFDQINHQKGLGSLCASPASTAVYLMYRSSWDDDAEAYLRHIVNLSINQEGRGIPDFYPSTTFETSWVVSTLLESGFCPNDFSLDCREKVITMLQSELKEQDGVTGWSRGLLPDPDDTAKTLSTLYLLGAPHSPDALLRTYEGKDHFFTYPQERNPSVSVNANVLMCLLHLSQGADYSIAIEKCVRFLCGRWWDGQLQDKWNLSMFYTMMLITRSFSHYLIKLDEGHVKPLPNDLLHHRLPAVLVQAMSRVLLMQCPDGSWGPHQSKEETAYAVLLLQDVCSLPFTKQFRVVCEDAIKRARDFLRLRPELPYSNHLWNAKITCYIPTISKAYILSALNGMAYHEFSDTIESLFVLQPEVVAKQVALYAKLPSFASVPRWMLEASAIEAQFFSQKMPDINILDQKLALDSAYHFNLALSLLAKGHAAFVEYEKIVHGAFSEIAVEYPHLVADTRNGIPPPSSSISQAPLDGVGLNEAIGYCTSWMLENPVVKRASLYDRTSLLVEARHVWLSNMFQMHYSHTFHVTCHATSDNFAAVGYRFHRWAHGIGADSSFAPVLLAFIICLVSTGGEDVFPTAIGKYLVQDWARRTAVESRLRNDFPTWEKDRQNSNINSLDFLEFHNERITSRRVDAAKEQLGQVIKFEHDMADRCWQKLRDVAEPRSAKVMAGLCFYRAVTEAHLDLYALRDPYQSYKADPSKA
ncbi:uncharacterized protein N7503_010600 [Penicillium pulvis]|uniref:uncharacterized protein n=1 Tax=Penicillium pulvis TaxID=1562058 RepID=UPI0025484FFF|nr:uncharacterized protein N7503_010600 [Penicillium pulvis]KAJ5785388.1 hypothetical protein N7503_010600 [Penicillium pulvis]